MSLASRDTESANLEAAVLDDLVSEFLKKHFEARLSGGVLTVYESRYRNLSESERLNLPHANLSFVYNGSSRVLNCRCFAELNPKVSDIVAPIAKAYKIRADFPLRL